MITELEERSASFATQLTELFSSCLAAAPQFDVVGVGDTGQVRIGPAPFNIDSGPSGGFSYVPLLRDGELETAPRMMLKIEFSMVMDDEEEHLTVQRSTYGLFVQPNPGRGPRPVYRIEYDRNARNKPPAHVHFHAESLEFGWIYGSAGQPMPRMDEIHFPVGGSRFRPTVEEMLQFLDREGIYSDWKDGWQTAVETSLREWEERQVRATVRRHRDIAVEQLRSMNFVVHPPE